MLTITHKQRKKEMFGYFKMILSGTVVVGGFYLLSDYLSSQRIVSSYDQVLSDAARPARSDGSSLVEFLSKSSQVDESMDIPPIVDNSHREAKTYSVEVIFKGDHVPSRVTEVSTIYGEDHAKYLAYMLVRKELGPSVLIGFQCVVREK